MTWLVVFMLYALALAALLAHRGFRGANAPRTPASPVPRPDRILVVGATGGTGRLLVEQALARGYHVTALARNPAKLAIEHPRLVVRQGDVLDPRSVDAAMQGQQAVVCALGHKRFLGPTRILSEGTRVLLQSMARHGVRRLVCETSLGIGDSVGRLGLYYTFFTVPVILPFYYYDKTRQERLIAASGLDWTIVRPGLLTGRPARGRYRHGPRIGSYLASLRISRADVADFMLDQLETDLYLRAAPALAG